METQKKTALTANEYLIKNQFKQNGDFKIVFLRTAEYAISLREQEIKTIIIQKMNELEDKEKKKLLKELIEAI